MIYIILVSAMLATLIGLPQGCFNPSPRRP